MDWETVVLFQLAFFEGPEQVKHALKKTVLE